MIDVAFVRRMAPSVLVSVVLCSVLVLVGCASRAASPAATNPRPTLLLISLDGVRPDYLGRGETPHLDALARGGVHGWMRPSYPSLTFPNHYTLVTGLRPDRHGIVHNSMHDTALGDFKLSDRSAVENAAWWNDGEPLWVTAENAGLATATLSWPGSEAPVRGVRPTRWLPFDKTRPLDTRVDTMLGWLSEPDATRPRLATLYFEHVDSAGHHDGPNAPQTHAALREVDAAIGRLVAGLRARGVFDRTSIVVVSDHGMAEVAPGHAIAVEDMVAPEEARVVSIGQVVGIAPLPGHEAAVAARLLGAHPRYDCWRKEALPARWAYGRHPRVPPIVCQMHEGWDALPRETVATRDAGPRGSHGFDPALPSMRAVFIAHGPAFREGVVLNGFDNVDVYPLLARLIGVAPADHDGDAATLLPALRSGDRR
ncbi:ectonucleotide pyrophosphatase/phosphodiesterase [Luteimonas sp. S4-F44]|uniref:alkaline phosphatase family protein n=1 Tax=Luteimonas sp. S4-F44 TaxID=2925842 RepID=UPI001F53A7FC|nr:ectonucleotide pyrophosphatase/phosphodiesterase [Luteimonas sp. S4-F44]UNK43400.1 ectonucleotide pyrophosphatase/phosphodiesterase [Luteimonas sp. S4-F44]